MSGAFFSPAFYRNFFADISPDGSAVMHENTRGARLAQ
jgi:hypothetical protein